MTRINTNVGSLVAQNTLGRSNADLSQALTRLSTGLRINTGKDDPAGLIASENLRSDITSIRRAIGNTDRANQVIATADSALGQVSSLLNDIRGLVTESANAGALSPDQISANQLQLDSSLEALNRIAQTTTFQGRRLLDGSLDFLTTAGTNFSDISNLQIDQANLGTTGSVSVDVNVSTAATQAVVQVASVPGGIAGVTASAGELDFVTAAVTGVTGVTEVLANTATDGTTIDLTNASATIDVTAITGQDLAGADGNITIAFADTATAGSETAVLVGTTLTIGVESGTSTLTQTLAAINGYDGGGTAGADLNAVLTTGAGATAFNAGDNGVTGALAGGVTEVTAVTAVTEVNTQISIAATANGAAFNRTIVFDDTGVVGAGVTATDAAGTLTIAVDSTAGATFAEIEAAIEAEIGTTDFTTTVTTAGGTAVAHASANTTNADPTVTDIGAATAGVTAGGGLTAAIVIELAGTDGSEVLSFGAGTTIAELVTGINLVSDATGVTAGVNGITATTLDLTSAAYGSNSFVDLTAITDTASLITDARDEGSNIVASVNGVSATGNGNELSINTATLDLSTSITAGFTGTASFTITGGGALFQLGPDVVSNQQARLGIGSVNTARLGGTSGKLFSLGTGGANELTSSSLNISAQIVEEAIDQVTSLRGRLGAFQRTTLETNKQALNDTLINLTDAESSIRDADFAAESAKLTRAQILVQSGTTVLSIANQNPQNVLALLR